MTFNEPLQTNSTGSLVITVDDFQLSFDSNGGTATSALITGLTTTSDTSLQGSETVVRFLISVTGTPSLANE